ncbi:hypothetical protein E2N92_06840 [Methanofollis formosanus]|uniref:Uncharacterized protein n=1 Tax=Methanofollis formosanus TaxID=299308 RepID=A0A8G1EGH1_9EURY|nr:hypothetical protein [Methanofollis formosanus]QYZ79169.1 hypothetical protein E2N92_06840 [Methanofollis formosanus]
MAKTPVSTRALLLPLALLVLAPFIAIAASRTPQEQTLLWTAAGILALLIVPAVGTRLIAGEEELNPFVAALCSAGLPGFGQVTNGQLGKGFLVCVLCAFGLKEATVIGGLIAGGAWLCSAADAFVTARRMHTGSVPLLPVSRAIFIEYVVLGFAAAYALP